ncbi:MAG: hypothetical protein DMG94_10265 [Acidobacteria bacterium]|nr:MAG: hypothetical protein DMG94_10265 [Acidobacteriota bacterium]
MARNSSRGARLAVKEARLITAELRRLGVPPRVIAKIWVAVIAVPVMLIAGYLLVNYDSGIDDSAILNEVTITFKDQYQSHVHNETEITLKSLTLTCSPGGDAVRTTSGLYPPLKPGYGEDAYVQAGMQARAGERESSIVVSADSLHAGCSR